MGRLVLVLRRAGIHDHGAVSGLREEARQWLRTRSTDQWAKPWPSEDAREKRILATPSLASRFWMASGKQAYLFITRRIFRWRDREGAGDRGASPGR